MSIKKPDELHILDGTFRGDRHGDPSASIVADGEPVCPKFVRGLARDYWNRNVPGLIARGVAKECDTDALALMCRMWALEQKLLNSLDRMPLGARGHAGRVRALGVVHEKWVKLAESFGLTCGSRSKLRRPANETKKPRVESRKRG